MKTRALRTFLIVGLIASGCGLAYPVLGQSLGPPAATSPRPSPLSDAAGQRVYSDVDWCALFTDDGSLMPIEACVTKVRSLFGDPAARLVPGSLLIPGAKPPTTVVMAKGKNDGETKAVWVSAGTYEVSIAVKGCAGAPFVGLMPVGDQELMVPRTLGDGMFVNDLEEGEYSFQVIGVPKDFSKPCTWRIRLTPATEQASVRSLGGRDD